MKGQPFDPRDHEAFVREIDESRYAIEKDMVPRGVIPKRRGMSLSKSLSMEGVFPFPNFAPRLLASLVASSTADCTSGVVTVSATAHGISATIFNGWSFYYPGSVSLAAGWYSEFNRTGANTLTFSAPASADFTSESVNGGAELVDEVTFDSLTLPANALRVGSVVEVPIYRHSNNTAGTRTVKQKLGYNTLSSAAITSTATLNGVTSFGGVVSDATTAFGSVIFGTLGSSYSKAAIDINTAMDISITGQLSAASMYLAVLIPHVRIQ